MPNYPNNEVEREVRSRISGAMEDLIRKRDASLRELAASKYAPGPGMGSGPYEEMRVDVCVDFYESLFQQIVDNWVDVLTRQNGKITSGDVDYVIDELEGWASRAPSHVRRGLAARGGTAHLLPPGAIKALEGRVEVRMSGLTARHRRELQTRLYNQDHPHPKDIPFVPNVNITKINSDNVNSAVASGVGNAINLTPVNTKGWWETWWGVIVTGVIVTVIGGLVVWAIPRYFDKPSVGSPKPTIASQEPLVRQSATPLPSTGTGELSQRVPIKPADSVASKINRRKPAPNLSAPTVPEPAAPAHQLNWHDKQSWRKFLHTGMTRTAVRDLFGEPDEMHVSGDLEFWQYGHDIGARITFDMRSSPDGSLFSWDEPDGRQ